jgi:hypothetical protein
VIYVPRVVSPELIRKNGSSTRADATTSYEAPEPKLDDGMISESDVSISIWLIRYSSFVDPLRGGGVGRLLLIGFQLAHAVCVYKVGTFRCFLICEVQRARRDSKQTSSGGCRRPWPSQIEDAVESEHEATN